MCKTFYLFLWKLESEECFALDTFLSVRPSSCSLITINFFVSLLILSDGSGRKFKLFTHGLASGKTEIYTGISIWPPCFFPTLISESRHWNFDKVWNSALGKAIRDFFPFFFKKKFVIAGIWLGSILDGKHMRSAFQWLSENDTRIKKTLCNASKTDQW